MRIPTDVLYGPPIDQDWQLGKRWQAACQALVTRSIVLLALLWLVRLVDFFYLGIGYSLAAYSWKVALKGLWYDTALFLVAAAGLSLPFLLLYMLKPLWARILYGAAVLIIVAASWGLIKYFSVAFVPLGADFFGYTVEDIQQTVKASGNTNLWSSWPLFLFLLVWWWLFKQLSKLVWPKNMVWGFLGLMGVSLLFTDYLLPDPRAYKTDIEQYVVSNKLGYFLARAKGHFFQDKETEELVKAAYWLEDENTPKAGAFDRDSADVNR